MEGRRSWKHASDRLRRSRVEWEQLLKEYEKSSCSVKEFCVQYGLAISTFHRWQKQLKFELNESHEAAPTGFIPLAITEVGEEIQRGDPWHLRVNERFDLWIPEDFKESLLKRLLKVLISC